MLIKKKILSCLYKQNHGLIGNLLSSPDSDVLMDRRRKVSGEGTTKASSDNTSAQYSTCCLPSYRLPPVPAWYSSSAAYKIAH